MEKVTAFVGLTIAKWFWLGLPDKDENGNTIEDDFSQLPFPSQYYAR